MGTCVYTLYEEHVDCESLQYCTRNVVYKVFIIYDSIFCTQLIISNRDDVCREACIMYMSSGTEKRTILGG